MQTIAMDVMIPVKALWRDREGEFKDQSWRRATARIDVPSVSETDVERNPLQLGAVFLNGAFQSIAYQGRIYLPVHNARPRMGDSPLTVQRFLERFGPGQPQPVHMYLSPFSYLGVSCSSLLEAKDRKGLRLDRESVGEAQSYFADVAGRQLLVVNGHVYSDVGQICIALIKKHNEISLVPALRHHGGRALRPGTSPDCNPWLVLGRHADQAEPGPSLTLLSLDKHAMALEALAGQDVVTPPDLGDPRDWSIGQSDTCPRQRDDLAEFLLETKSMLVLSFRRLQLARWPDRALELWADFEIASRNPGRPELAMEALSTLRDELERQRRDNGSIRDEIAEAIRIADLALFRWNAIEVPLLGMGTGMKP